ncbi:YebG family protein [Psychrosphaera sp. B3R10]|uniref:YebG family protein n=1 Tax=unclassified Psychrosphaera TaxID=2641570 RepID=UPI001C09B1FD|nr:MULTISPECIES: YebG family protein [unclassified Psychrosphaera]MBU2881634.1 YebG family protein [Psychrosphaera sp. I2R16]MBU2991111.1 YebG family protein [Psychrosphaera sp. B3R10]
MAVATQYVVIRTTRQNEEQEVMTFTDKRAADDYDKMLDMADGMFELLHNSDVTLSEEQCEELSIFLAKEREEVLIALQAKKKPVPKKSEKSVKAKATDKNQADLLDEEQISNQSLSDTLIVKKDSKNKQSKSVAETDSDDKLVDFVIEKDEAA